LSQFDGIGARTALQAGYSERKNETNRKEQQKTTIQPLDGKEVSA
jgi:hypothetical protein